MTPYTPETVDKIYRERAKRRPLAVGDFVIRATGGSFYRGVWCLVTDSDLPGRFAAIRFGPIDHECSGRIWSGWHSEIRLVFDRNDWPQFCRVTPADAGRWLQDVPLTDPQEPLADILNPPPASRPLGVGDWIADKEGRVAAIGVSMYGLFRVGIGKQPIVPNDPLALTRGEAVELLGYLGDYTRIIPATDEVRDMLCAWRAGT